MNTAAAWPDPGDKQVIELASADVKVESLVPGLKDFLVRLGRIHFGLMEKPLIITSGTDGKHATNSPHYSGRAVDVRSHDKSDDENAIFGAILMFFAPAVKIATFDERNVPGGPHFHIEWHGA